MWRKFHMGLATSSLNIWVLIVIFLKESQRLCKPLFKERLSTSTNTLKIRWSMIIQTQSTGILLQYYILTTGNHFKEMQDKKAGMTKFFYIRQVERSKIRWPWHNTCQSICLRNMKMKQFLPLLNMGCLSENPLIHNQFLPWLMMSI